MIEINKIYQESCLDTINRMDDCCVDSVITSPPYWQLRDYGYDGQWGLEPTYQEYLEHLWQMMDGIWRILKNTGTVWINLGDTYGGTGTKKGQYGKLSYIQQYEFKGNSEISKCLLLIPHRFAIGCIDRGWILRNDIIWAKRNGMPEPVRDRFSKKHEFFFLFVKQEKYYFDLDAIRDKCPPLNRWGGNKLVANGNSNWDEGTGQNSYRDRDMQPNNGMKNHGDVADFWNIPTKPSNNKHYASYNDSLLIKPVLAGCPIGGVIYDPFMGTGTTAEVAFRSGRNYIGSEMSEKYCKIAEDILCPLRTQQKFDL